MYTSTKEKPWNWNVVDGGKETKPDTFEFELTPSPDNDDHSIVVAPIDCENEQDEEEVLNEGDEEEETELRRSDRVRNKPSYLDDYILLAEIECERLLMVINNEPWDFNEAKDLKVWVNACEDELKSIEKNKTWILVDLPRGFKPIGLKWVFKIKRNTYGSISKYNARLVAK